jgi:hypothetical protein
VKADAMAPKINTRNLMVAALLTLLLGLGLWIVVAHHRLDPIQAGPTQAQIAFEQTTGIRIIRVALTAGDGLADIHYQVLDPDKAVVVHDRQRPPTLVEPRSGARLNTPFHGHGFRELHTGVVYRLHLWNTGDALKRGQRITVIVGEAKLEDLVVQ